MADHIQARALCFFAIHVVVIVAAIVYEIYIAAVARQLTSSPQSNVDRRERLRK
jgi:hypothetical protein